MPYRRPPTSRLAALVRIRALWALGVVGCGGGDLVLPSDAEPRIEVRQGDDQVGSPGSALRDPLIVRLVDPSGAGIAGRAVVWVVSAGGGSIAPAASTTDAEGFAYAQWILGPVPGPNTVRAEVPEIGVVTFTAMGSPDGGGGDDDQPSASRSTVSADPASIPVGTGRSTIAVRVLDEDGDPVEGATVTLQATGSGNTLTQPAGPTGSDGIATGALQSTVPETKEISATVNGFVRVGQTAVVTVTPAAPAPPARIEEMEGDGQSGPAGSQVSTRPAVRVLDAAGAPVAGVAVTFGVTGGGGSVEGAAQTTGSDGIARVGGWTLGSAPGTNTLEARAGSLAGSPVVFTAEGTGSAPGVDRLVFRVPPRDVEENETFRVEVALVDAAGNLVPLSGIFIYLGLFPEGSATPTNDHLEGERFENTVNGIAVLDLQVSREGRYRLRALTDDLPELGPHGPEPYLFSDLFRVD